MRTSWYLGVALACAAVVLPSGQVWADGTPSWERLPPMITPRSGHTATLLQDGRVLVAGGHGSDGTVLLREVEVYGPASKTWTPAAPLRSPLRDVAATAVLPSGLALSTDGEHVEVYSPELDLWSAAAPLTPALTTPHAVTLPSGKLLMLGRASGALAGSIYDDAAGTWTPIRSLSGMTATSATLLRDGRVLAAGFGRGNIYDPETDSWTPASGYLGGAMQYPATRLASGDVLFVGGYPFANMHPSQLYLPEENLWVAIPGHDPFYYPYPECYPPEDYDMGLGVSLLPSGSVLLTGGMVTYLCGIQDENGAYLNEWRYSEFSAALELYDPAKAFWVPLEVEPPETMARGYHTATSLDDGSVLIAGGLVASGSPGGVPVPTGSALLFHERAPLGAACQAGGDCASGFCADSVCCDAACAGPCDACAASAGATKDGACTPISGTPCDDTGACLKGGVCEAGTCAGGAPAPDGTPCDDAEVCSATSACEAGACVAASPASCQPPDGCHEAPACDAALGCSGPAPEKPDGARCDVAGTPDAWQTAARMPDEMKSAGIAAVLEDGTVLVVGLESSSPVRWRWMRYDPSMDQWQLIGGAPQVRSIVHTTLLHDGTVLVISDDRVDRFNPATGAWVQAASMLRKHSIGTATLLQDGRVLVAAGNDESAEVYDPTTNVWTLVAPLNVRRFQHRATLLQDGRVLVTGGGNQSASAEVYDPAADVWTPVASMSQARTSHAATLLQDGRVLVVGRSHDGVALTTAELYDPESDTWAPAAEMVARRYYVNATVLLADGRVLVAGELEGPYSLDYTVELYDPARDIWSPGPAVNIPLTHGAVARLHDGRVLMAGGSLGSAYYPSPLVHFYVPGQGPSTGVCQAGVCLPGAGGEGGAGGSGGDASGGSGGSGDATSGAGGSGGDASGGSGDATSGAGGSGAGVSASGGSGDAASGAGGDGSGGGVSGSGGSGDAASGAGGDASGSGGGVSGSGDATSGAGGSGGATSGAGGSGGATSGAGGSGGATSGAGGSGGDVSGAGGSGGDASGAGGSDGTTSTSAGAISGTGEGGSAGDTGAQSGAGGGPPGGAIGGWHCQMGPGIQGTPAWLVLVGGLAALRLRRRAVRIRGAA
ncbi:kelch repeat-containing protein [Sorangium sp. So ce381]|uniref:kelch repeat-containing protein n=1 Tax=Sorangium sp. So ce381 TaxID=3133307 RepID=UPI003F5B7548